MWICKWEVSLHNLFGFINLQVSERVVWDQEIWVLCSDWLGAAISPSLNNIALLCLTCSSIQQILVKYFLYAKQWNFPYKVYFYLISLLVINLGRLKKIYVDSPLDSNTSLHRLAEYVVPARLVNEQVML